ncbi:MAG: nuclear transport factor 2 family protein [Deinococcota bacterium]
MANVTPAGELVKAYLEAFFSSPADLHKIRSLLADAFTFRGPLMQAASADDYINQLSQMGPINLQADIHHILACGNTVSVLYSFVMGSKQLPASEWYDVQDGKILSIQLCNDPRPFLEAFGQ